MATRAVIAGTPFGSKDAQVYQLAHDVEVAHSKRMNEYRKLWRFYKGDQWDWTRDQNEPFVTVNYCRAFVDAHVNFLFKHGFRCTVPDDPSTPQREDEDREFIRHMLDETWRRNRLQSLCFEMGQMGSVTGDLFLRVSWEENDMLEEPYARVDVLPSQYVFPDFGGPRGVDRKKVNSILVLYPHYATGTDKGYERRRGATEFVSLNRGKKLDIRLYAERWYPDKCVKMYDDGRPDETIPNPLGEIPIVHIPNYPVASEYYGKSDLMDILALQQEYNEKSTDVSDVINYHGSPVTIVTGAKLSNLERGASRMWGLPEGASVTNLALSGELGSSLKYLENVKKSMHELAGIPLGLLGAFQESGSGMSGSALAMRYLPLIERRNVKIQTYGLGLRLVNRLILKITSLKDGKFGKALSKLDGNKYRNDIVFPDPLPRDETMELDRAAKRLQLGLSTKRMELEKMGLSQSEIDKVMDDFKDETMEQAEMEFEVGQKLYTPGENYGAGDPRRSGNPDPERGNPDARGEKGSITKQQKAESGE